MNRKWIVIDGNAIAWAGFHACGDLSYQNTPTGVSFFFLGKILDLQRELATEHVAICFDYGRSKRYKMCSTYKATRNKKRDDDPEVRARFVSVCQQIDTLRKQHLKSIGFRNVFYAKGFEADDMIASVCNNLRAGDEAVIVSADHDMWQLIRHNVSVFIPTVKKHITRKSFVQEYGFSPRKWVDVKCLAGCSTDDIPGISGIGEKTAAKYLRGELKPTSVAYKKIIQGIKRGIMETNRPLVELPLAGTPECIPRTQKQSLSWQPTLKALNIKSLDPDFAPPPYRE